MITFHLPMKVSLEQIPDKKDYYAFLYGPIVLATSTGTENLDGIYADDSRGGHIAHGRQTPLQEIPMLIGNPDSIRHSLHKLSGSKLALVMMETFIRHKRVNHWSLFRFPPA